MFTIAIDFLLAEFVGCEIVILNIIEYKRFFFNMEGVLVQLNCTWN